jgi:hypothetical protein
MHLIDLTFGAGGLALYLLGLPTVCSYMGAKHAYGFALQHGIGLVEPATVVGVEPGEWANAHNMIAREDDRVKVIEWLRRWRDEVNEHLDGVEASGRDRFDRSIPCPPYTKVKLGRVPEDPHRRAAAFLFLQGVNYKSKAVYVVDTADGPRWHTDGEKHCLRGLAKTAPREATGERAGSKGFGAIVPFLGDGRQEMNPSRPVGLVQRLEAAQGDAVVCIDHDYDGTTGYGSGSYPLADVIDHADLADSLGAVVLVHETRPIHELCGPPDVGHEWRALDITRCRKGYRSKQGEVREWLTFNRMRISGANGSAASSKWCPRPFGGVGAHRYFRAQQLVASSGPKRPASLVSMLAISEWEAQAIVPLLVANGHMDEPEPVEPRPVRAPAVPAEAPVEPQGVQAPVAEPAALGAQRLGGPDDRGPGRTGGVMRISDPRWGGSW